MLADLLYLSMTWLVPAFGLLLLLGPRWRWRHWLLSLAYLLLLLSLGDAIALIWFALPPMLVAAASLAMLALGLLLIRALRNWNAVGQVFFLFSLTTTAIYLCYAFFVTVFSPLSPIAFLFSFGLFGLELTSLSLAMSYAFEVLDVICRVRWLRRPAPVPLLSYVPKVSLHIPAYNEPPELVAQTLHALARLDYPNYEVILIDNNTPDEAAWQPLAAICRRYGFKCLHLDQWPGYKSGALNFALAMTDPQAEIIGVIDADYLIQPDFLRRMVPYFVDPTVAFVQTPQDYRDQHTGRFAQATYDGYQYFFALSMPARNDRNAIIFCGTMGLLRRSVLQEIGGWDEWCITEDAEASLRILNRGYQALYVPETFGRGLMPLNFDGLKKQRFRWAFGGVQILKKHWSKLMPWAHWVDPENRLTAAQRYFYLTAGLQWFNELLTLAFTIMVLISAALTFTGHTALLRPTTAAFVVLPLVLIGTNMLRALWGLVHSLHISYRRAISALTLWFALTWVVALACLQAVVRKRGVFLRTPKSASQAAWARALQTTSLETLLGGACLVGAMAAIARSPSVLAFGLAAVCLSQSAIYLSAASHSLQSLRDAPRAAQPDRGAVAGTYAVESRLGLQIGLIALLLGGLALLATLWPAPNHMPWWYNYLNPQPLLNPQVLPGSHLPQLTETPLPTLGAPTITPTATKLPATTPPPRPSLSATQGASSTPAPGATTAPSATLAPAATATRGPTPGATATPPPATTATPGATATPPPAITATPGATSTNGPTPGTTATAPPVATTIAPLATTVTRPPTPGVTTTAPPATSTAVPQATR